MITVTNLSGFNTKITAWVKAVERAAEVAAMNMAQEALENVTRHGPQYSGQFVASWNLSINSPNYASFQPASKLIGDSVDPYKEGDSEAIGHAISRNMGALGGFKLGQTIYLSNSVAHDEPYSVKIENNAIAFRPENPSGGRTLARAYDYVSQRYATIGKAHLSRLIGA